MSSIEIVVRKPTAEDLAIADLNRKATRHKAAGNLDSAIACLRQAKEIAAAHRIPRAIEPALRLPLFLQQGGYFDAAMIEFEHLLTQAEAIAAFGLEHLPPFFRIGNAQHVRSLIYDKMRVACKREKRTVEAGQYEAARDTCREEFERYQKMMDLHRQRERKNHAAKTKRVSP